MGAKLFRTPLTAFPRLAARFALIRSGLTPRLFQDTSCGTAKARELEFYHTRKFGRMRSRNMVSENFPRKLLLAEGKSKKWAYVGSANLSESAW